MRLAEANRIGRLRIVGATGAHGPAGLAFARLIERAEVAPVAMPPASVLIVRRVADPIPGRLSQRLTGALDAGWERAARVQLTDAFRRAARPARGEAAEATDAVVFADEAELLACLAYDLATGAGGRWWWRELVPLARVHGAVPLARLLIANAVSVPAALSWLARRRRATPVLLAIQAAEARAVLRAICTAHGLPDLSLGPAHASVPAGVPAAIQAPQLAAEGSNSAPVGDTPSWAASPAARSASPAAAPWLAWMPSGAADTVLGVERLAVLGVAVTLHATPAVARSQGFAAATLRWWAEAQRAQSRRPASGTSPAPPDPVPTAGSPASLPAQSSSRSVIDALPTEGGTAVPPMQSEPVQAPHARTVPRGHEVRSGVKAETSLGMVSGTEEPNTPSPTAAVPREPEAREPSGPIPIVLHAEEVSPDTPPLARSTAAPAADVTYQKVQVAASTSTPEEDAAAAFEGGVETALGGVLFLINVMVALDLPECFETDWQLARRLGHWGTLEALARALLDPATAEDCDDPIWPALAALAGREPGAKLGTGLPRRARFRLPPHWPKAAEAYGLPRSPLLACIEPPLGRWLANAIPPIRHRLIAALADEGPLTALLRRPGRLHVTLTHVDLMLPLDAVSMAARIAGLDRDPGWLPAFGRVVLFHFA